MEPIVQGKGGSVVLRRQSFIGVIQVLADWLTGCTGTTSSGDLIDCRRAGGFAGLDDHLVIDVNGNVTLTRKTQCYEFTLDSDMLNQIQNAFDEAEFIKLDRKYLPSRHGSDFFEYVVTYKGYTVQTMDPAVPESLWPVLELLDQIIANIGKP